MLFSQQAILYGGTGPAVFPQPGESLQGDLAACEPDYEVEHPMALCSKCMVRIACSLWKLFAIHVLQRFRPRLLYPLQAISIQ